MSWDIEANMDGLLNDGWVCMYCKYTLTMMRISGLTWLDFTTSTSYKSNILVPRRKHDHDHFQSFIWFFSWKSGSFLKWNDLLDFRMDLLPVNQFNYVPNV